MLNYCYISFVQCISSRCEHQTHVDTRIVDKVKQSHTLVNSFYKLTRRLNNLGLSNFGLTAYHRFTKRLQTDTNINVNKNKNQDENGISSTTPSWAIPFFYIAILVIAIYIAMLLLRVLGLFIQITIVSFVVYVLWKAYKGER